MDLVLKYLPLIIFIYPILTWLDSRKRFTYNAKFYADRALSVKRYEEECSREGIKTIKSAFAQTLARTDKLGFRDIDIIKSKFPDSLFVMITIAINFTQGKSTTQSSDLLCRFNFKGWNKPTRCDYHSEGN